MVPDYRLQLVRVDSLDLSDHSHLHFLVLVLRLPRVLKFATYDDLIGGRMVLLIGH